MREIIVIIFGKHVFGKIESPTEPPMQSSENPQQVRPAPLAMELAQKCGLSKKASSLAPLDFQSHLTTEHFPMRHWKDKHPSHLLFEIVIQRLFIQDMTSKWILPHVPPQDVCTSSSLCFQCSSLQSLQGWVSLYSGLNSNITSLEMTSQITQAKAPTLSSKLYGLGLARIFPLSEIILFIFCLLLNSHPLCGSAIRA